MQKTVEISQYKDHTKIRTSKRWLFFFRDFCYPQM